MVFYNHLDREWDKYKRIGPINSFIPTEDQKCAAEKIDQFLSDYKEKIFLLKGYAGTGKTTIVNHVLHKYYLQGRRICVCAFTNKATNEISKKTPFAVALSLYKLLGLRSEEDSETLKFDFAGKSRIEDFDIIVVDECSMIRDTDFDILQDELKYNYKVKVIIMGDPAQLPPVDQKEDSKTFNIENSYEIKEIVRQAKNSSIPLYSFYIRQILASKQEIPINIRLPRPENCEDILFLDDSKDFIKLMLEAFSSVDYKSNSDFVKVIAYRNHTIDKINLIIRKNLFGSEIESLMIGENIMLNAPVFDEETGYAMYDTSDEIEVIHIIDKQTYKETKHGTKIEFDYYLAETKRKYDNKIHIMKIVGPDQKTVFTDLMKLWGKAIAKRSNSKVIFRTEYYPFKKQFHNVSYNYAITSHRAQGSTYTKVFVVEDDIDQVAKASVKNLYQSKYVSITRASKQLIILNRVKDRPRLEDIFK